MNNNLKPIELLFFSRETTGKTCEISPLVSYAGEVRRKFRLPNREKNSFFLGLGLCQRSINGFADIP